MNMEEQQQTSPPGEPKKKRTGLIVFIIILAVVILIGGYFLTLYLLNKKVQDTLGKGIEQIDLSINCRSIELQAQVTEIGEGQYEVRLINNGNEDVRTKLKLLKDSSESNILDFEERIPALTSKTKTLDFEITEADKLEIIPYFINEFGEELICPTTISIDI